MNKTTYFLKKHSSTILTVISAGGVVATTVLAVKATPKATQLMLEAEQEKGEKLSPMEVVKVAWKPYIPAAISGISTIVCIFGVNHISAKKQASLMSAYALLENSFKEYRKQTELLYGEEADENIRNKIVESKFNENELESHEEKLWFFDYQSMQFFESTMQHVMQAECKFIETLNDRGYACINEYYDILGIPGTEYGYQLGWYDLEDNDPYNCHGLEINYEEINMDDDKKCWVITFSMPPSFDYVI